MSAAHTPLTEAEMIFAAELLDLASERYSNDVCTDLNDSCFEKWTDEQRAQLVKESHDYNGDPEEFTGQTYIDNWIAMWILAHKLRTHGAQVIADLRAARAEAERCGV